MMTLVLRDKCPCGGKLEVQIDGELDEPVLIRNLIARCRKCGKTTPSVLRIRCIPLPFKTVQEN